MNKEFKVYYNNAPATQEQLDAIEEIVVEQEIGRAWEARIKIPVCIGEDGSWEKEDDPAYVEYARVRIEARVGNGEFAPLIEGRIISQQPDYNAVPGVSTVTLTVHDDSTLLHRQAESESFAGKPDSEIVQALFESGELGGNIEIDEIPEHPDSSAVLNRHGTAMQMLRTIAARYRNYYAYVLPGASPGASDGFFKKLPEQPDTGLATLYLVGDQQNLSQFNISRNSNRAAAYDSSSLNMSDKSARSATTSYNATPPSDGDTATGGTDGDIRHRRLPPGDGDLTDPQDATDGAAEESSFTLSAEGSVLPSCYPSILSPYKMVPVRVSNSRYSSNYVIFKVIHTLSRSEYTQSFSVRGNTVSPAASPSASMPAPSAGAAAVAATFNIQVDIF